MGPRSRTMNLQNRQQVLGVVAIVAVALLAGDRLIVEPLLRIWKERATTIAQTKRSVEQGSRLIERDRVIRERWNHMRTNTLANERTIAQSQVLASFDRWAQESRLAVTGVAPHWTSGTADDYATLECRVDASGNLAAITRFLYEI